MHAIIHRQEGPLDGEFGTGFSNANYWYRAAGPHPVQGALLAVAAEAAAGQPQLEQFVASHGGTWDPCKFVTLCSRAAEAAAAAASGGRGGGGGGGAPAASEQQQLAAFCEHVAKAEWRLLLDHCYEKANR